LEKPAEEKPGWENQLTGETNDGFPCTGEHNTIKEKEQ
jgi:hypothetical protein